MVARHTLVCGVRARGHRDARIGLEEAVNVIADAPYRPAAPDFAGVERFEGDAARAHAVRVGRDVDSAVTRTEIEPTGGQDELLSGVAFDVSPRRIRALRQTHVLGRVVRQTDD